MTPQEKAERARELGPWFYPYDFGDGVRAESYTPPEVAGIFETRREMAERAVQGEPVDVLVGRRDRVNMDLLAPFAGIAVGADAAIGALVEMAMRGDEAGQDDLAARVDSFGRRQGRWRLAGADMRNAPLVVDGHEADVGRRGEIRHRQQRGVADEELLPRGLG